MRFICNVPCEALDGCRGRVRRSGPRVHRPLAAGFSDRSACCQNSRRIPRVGDYWVVCVPENTSADFWQQAIFDSNRYDQPCYFLRNDSNGRARSGRDGRVRR
ncbi:MAG TPA: hypothetical protein VFG55_01015 [Rhodanobacteraceae bacterium]|nr:hypothetical protein [Rhodanobacteraceae bacterium]